MGDGTLTSRFAFTHDLYVDVLYDRIPEVRRTRVHRHAGLALERIWSGRERERERAAELALHFRRARDRARAIRYLDVATGQAMQRSAYREAVLHFTAALELLEETGPSPQRNRTELAIRSRLAPSLIATRGWADALAEKNYQRACVLARAAGASTLLSQMLYGMAVMSNTVATTAGRNGSSWSGWRSTETRPSRTPWSRTSFWPARCCTRDATPNVWIVGSAPSPAAERDPGPSDAGTVLVLVQAHG